MTKLLPHQKKDFLTFLVISVFLLVVAIQTSMQLRFDTDFDLFVLQIAPIPIFGLLVFFLSRSKNKNPWFLLLKNTIIILYGLSVPIMFVIGKMLLGFASA